MTTPHRPIVVQTRVRASQGSRWREVCRSTSTAKAQASIASYAARFPQSEFRIKPTTP